MHIKAKFVDISGKSIYPAELIIENGRIKTISKLDNDSDCKHFIMPGFVDAHVHIESSMLVPSEFARIAVIHGTVATVSDPHEIANVCGLAGIEYMINDAANVSFKFSFGAPSCVPATTFETAGAIINSDDIDSLLQRNEIKYLSEMMNFPGVLNEDKEVMKKIAFAKKYGKPVDGHAPGLRGNDARKYIEAGMSTDHECFTIEEAQDKLSHGMKILIREGSAAKNFEALIPLLNDHADFIMFCSDDKHPDSLVDGHMNLLCKRAIAKGINVFNVLQAACINPVKHYKLDVGLLRENDAADFILVNNLTDFEVKATYINGKLVAEDGKSKIDAPSPPAGIINNFTADEINVNLIKCFADGDSLQAIAALDGQLITEKIFVKTSELVRDESRELHSNVHLDILKIVVLNRYNKAKPAVGFIKNFGFKEGAIASTVAHDSHNIIAVGVNDEDIVKAVNLVVRSKGGVSAVNNNRELLLPLPVAGLMSNGDGWKVAAEYTRIDQFAKDLGSRLSAPFMTLSFMALLVIPKLKMSDLGLFDGEHFCFVK